jgi:hypothetical protein
VPIIEDGFEKGHSEEATIRGGGGEAAQLNILMGAAEQLITHAGEMQKMFPDLRGLLVGGDFNTNGDQADFVSEKTLGMFAEAGFVNSFGTLPLVKRATHPGKGRYPDATLSSRKTSGGQCPEITGTVLSDHWPVTEDLLPR